MTLEKLPGVYFSETISTEYSSERKPLFIIETRESIPALDEQITEITDINTFKTLTTNKELTNTVKFIEQALAESLTGSFYVYSLKDSHSEVIYNTVVNTANMLDIRKICYIEETTNATPVADKISAIIDGINYCYNNGSFRTGYIIPYGTFREEYATANNSNADLTLEDYAITFFNGLNITSGKIALINPCTNAGVTLGKCFKTPYNEDPGFKPIDTSINSLEFNFNYTQALSLLNKGVLFLDSEIVKGVKTYRIKLGVTPAFKTSNGADALLINREIANELLSRVNYECTAFVKDKYAENNIKFLQTDVDTIIDEFVTNQDVVEEKTNLTVSIQGLSIKLQGTIKPVGCIEVIEVNTILN